MKTAEVEVNMKAVFKVNDKEHKAFKMACLENDEEMAQVFRAFARSYVAKTKKRKK